MVGNNLLSSDGFRRKADAHVLVIYIKPEETLRSARLQRCTKTPCLL